MSECRIPFGLVHLFYTSPSQTLSIITPSSSTDFLLKCDFLLNLSVRCSFPPTWIPHYTCSPYERAFDLVLAWFFVPPWPSAGAALWIACHPTSFSFPACSVSLSPPFTPAACRVPSAVPRLNSAGAWRLMIVRAARGRLVPLCSPYTVNVVLCLYLHSLPWVSCSALLRTPPDSCLFSRLVAVSGHALFPQRFHFSYRFSPRVVCVVPSASYAWLLLLWLAFLLR